MKTVSLDHVVLVVGDLAAATRQFTQLGFSVIPGGIHAGGLTQNALIPFPDGTYLELLATTRPSTGRLFRTLQRLRLLSFYTRDQNPIAKRFNESLASGLGIKDFAIRSENLEGDIEFLKQNGLECSYMITGGRQRPDGQGISWKTAMVLNTWLPFLIEDITPHELRVPPVTNEFHSNKIISIIGLTILVSTIVESIKLYRAFTNTEPESLSKYSLIGCQSIDFSFTGWVITLASPLRSNRAHRKYLASNNYRPFNLNLASHENGTFSLLYESDRGYTLSAYQDLNRMES